jgi:regulator of replication initiation timing
MKVQLENDKASLRKGNRISLARYDAKIKQYEAFLVEKDTLIANLQRENVTLATNVKVLDEENVGLKTERQKLTDSVTTVVSQNQELSTKVTRAAALKAQNVKVFAVSRKGKINDDDAYKAKRLDKIKLVYTLLDNPLTKEEPKDVFVRVLDPQGAVVSDMANGSGTFSVDGNETIYTTKQTVNYTSNGQNVELLYTRGIPYKPGKYTVELYSEGFRIGAGEFAVR